MCNVPSCHGSLICCFFVFHLYFLEKKIIFNVFFFYLFILSDCMGQGGPPCSRRNCTRSVTWMVWGHFPFLPVPWCAWRGAAGHGSIALSICLPLCCVCRVWVGGGGCSHSPRGPAYYLCLGLG